MLPSATDWLITICWVSRNIWWDYFKTHSSFIFNLFEFLMESTFLAVVYFKMSLYNKQTIWFETEFRRIWLPKKLKVRQKAANLRPISTWSNYRSYPCRTFNWDVGLFCLMSIKGVILAWSGLPQCLLVAFTLSSYVSHSHGGRLPCKKCLCKSLSQLPGSFKPCQRCVTGMQVWFKSIVGAKLRTQFVFTEIKSPVKWNTGEPNLPAPSEITESQHWCCIEQISLSSVSLVGSEILM